MTSLDLQFALFQNKRAVIEAIRDGAAAVDTLHTPTLGPVSTDRMDYPYAEVLPETTDYQSGNEYAHTVRLNCYFERTGDTDDYLLMLATAFDGIKQAVDHYNRPPIDPARCLCHCSTLVKSICRCSGVVSVMSSL